MGSCVSGAHRGKLPGIERWLILFNGTVLVIEQLIDVE